jgi:aminocarboxymuconate-semialdehyde decarboxylase
MAPVVNVHTHYQPESVLPLVAAHGIEMVRREGPAGPSWHFRSGDVEYNIPGVGDEFWGTGLGSRIEPMDAAGIDVHVLQPSPMVFGYHLDPAVNAAFSRAFNDETARHIGEFPARFWGSAQLPMQDLDLAAAELERGVRDLGLRSCSVGFGLGGGRTLADPACDEFLATVTGLDVPILLHPVALGQELDLAAAGGEWLLRHQLDWAWGYLFVETLAVVALILGGTLDRHPDLRVMIPHGGGMIPFQLGRLEHHARVFGTGHRDAGRGLERPPAEYLGNFYFDTVVHDPRALGLLIEVMGPDNVVMGSNYPGWDNAPIWELIRELPISDEAREKVLGRTAAERLFRVPVTG